MFEHDRPRVAFVLHRLDVAGAELLVRDLIGRLRALITPTICTLDALGTLAPALSEQGVEIHCVGRKPGLDPGCALRLARYCRHQSIDILHAHQYAPFFYSAMARVALGLRPRLIFTEHGRHYPDVVSARRRWVNRLVLRHLAHAVTGVSRFSVTALAEVDGFQGTRLQVIENGVDPAPFDALPDRDACRRRLGLPSDRTLLVHVGRFHPVKDHATLVDAFALLAGQHDDLDLLLVGDGPLRNTIEARVQSIQLQERVRFLGTRADVPAILRAADLFVSSSVSEAAPLTLLEAMAAGLPVVVTAVGGNPEIVRDGVHGRLVPRSDPHALARALAEVLDEPARARLGQAGAQRVREHFTLDHTAHRYLELYRAAASSAF